MPTYQYECDDCGHLFDYFQSMVDKKLRKCPECGKFKLHRLIGAGTGIIFRGSGFYETDYKNKSAPKVNTKTKPENSGCDSCEVTKSCPASKDNK
ncbi:MAG: zinc ribbon domain-containing protein [Candidatus Omnitrophica bacterium]|nr:zinc ribbon domain-containing protein [Candidatus Omnitrophota bacterium]